MKTEEDKSTKNRRTLDESAIAFTPVSRNDQKNRIKRIDNDMLREITLSLEQQANVEPNEMLKEPKPVRVVYNKKKASKKKKPARWTKVMSAVFVVTFCVTVTLFGTAWGRNKLKSMTIYLATEYAYTKMAYDNDSKISGYSSDKMRNELQTSKPESLDIIRGIQDMIRLEDMKIM